MEKSARCRYCGEQMSQDKILRGNLYCSPKCRALAYSRDMMENVERTGEFNTGYGGEANRRFVKAYLEKKVGHVCSICGRSEWDGHPIPLVVDHIDGNAMNSSLDNFRLVCGNCNMLLDTFAGRNRCGRSKRRKVC